MRPDFYTRFIQGYFDATRAELKKFFNELWSSDFGRFLNESEFFEKYNSIDNIAVKHDAENIERLKEIDKVQSFRWMMYERF